MGRNTEMGGSNRWLALVAAGLLFLAPACSRQPAAALPAPELVGRLGCLACHGLQGKGGTVAVPLDMVGRRLGAAEMQQVIEFPRRFHPGAKMPSYAYLPLPERQALAQFLASLK